MLVVVTKKFQKELFVETGLPTWSDTFNIDRTTIPVWVTHLGIWYVRNTDNKCFITTESSPTLQPQGRRTSHHQQLFRIIKILTAEVTDQADFHLRHHSTLVMFFEFVKKKRSSHKKFLKNRGDNKRQLEWN